MRSSREHQQQHWAAGHKQVCRKLALGIAAGLHVRAEGNPKVESGSKQTQEEAGSAQAQQLVPSRMVCPYEEFLALWPAADASDEGPTGLINLGNR